MACSCKQKSAGQVAPVKQVVKTISKQSTTSNTKKATPKSTTIKKISYRRPI